MNSKVRKEKIMYMRVIEEKLVVNQSIFLA